MGTMKRYIHVMCLAGVMMGLSACSGTASKSLGYGDPVGRLSDDERILATARNAALEERFGLVKSGALSKAEIAYLEHPNNVNALVDYSKILRQVQQYEKAAHIVSAKAMRDDAVMDVRDEYIKILLAKGDYEQAQNLIERWYVDAPKMPDAMRLNLAMVLDVQGYHQAALNHYQMLARQNGGDKDYKKRLYNNMAMTYIALDDMGEAEDYLMKAQNYTSDPYEIAVISGNRDLVRGL